MISAYSLPPQPLRMDTTQWVEVIPLYDSGELPWLLSAADAVVKQSALPANWDGESSERVRPVTVARAVEVLCKLGRALEPMSHVCPVSGGGLQLEWKFANRYLEVEIFPDGSVEYLTRQGLEEPKEASLSLTDTARLRELVNFLSHR